MTLDDAALIGALIAVFLCAVGTASNDSGSAVGPAVGSGTMPPRTALVATACLTTLALLLFSASGPTFLFADLLPAVAGDGGERFRLTIVAALFATGIVMIGLSALGVVVPAILCLAGAMLGAGLVAGTASMSGLAAFGILLAAGLGLTLVAGLVAAAAFAVLQHHVHLSERLRPGARSLLVAMTVMTCFLLPVAAFTADLDPSDRARNGLSMVGGIPMINWVVGPILGLCLAITGGLLLAAWLRNRPTWPDDSVIGAESAFRRVANGLALGLAPMTVAAQVAWVAAPAALVVANSRGGNSDWSSALGGDLVVDASVLVVALLGSLAGILLLGHKSVGTVGADVSAIGPTQATTSSLGTLIAVLLGRLFGFPGFGSLPAMGAVMSVGLVRGRGRIHAKAPLLSAGALLAGPIAAGMLAVVLTALVNLLAS